jgi:predicted Zn-dependent protease
MTPRAAALATAALFAACATNPATGRRQLSLVSEAQEIQMGKEADPQVVGSIGLVPQQDLQTYVQRVGTTLAASSERPSLQWTFRVVDDAAVNAFALPGGYIYVTRGLLAHMNSEAEWASVLGHEIGHVTARHSVSQMSKAQLLNIGLVVGMILRPQLQNFGGLAQAGMELLMMKYSRDDENQADELGLRYLTRAGYDPRPMAQVFRTLQRVGEAQGEGRVPGWMSTHPDPGDRGRRITAAITAQPGGQAGGRIERDSYLQRLDGLVFGDDPREGYFRGNAFYHPEMRFRFEFPPGWKPSNQKQAVGAMSPNQDAVVVITLANRPSAQAAYQEFFSQQGIQRGQPWRGNINGLPAYTNAFAAQTEQGVLQGLAAFVEHGGKVFQILGYAPSSQWPRHQATISNSVGSFASLTNARDLSVQPKRLDIVTLPQAMTIEEFARRYPSTVSVQTLAIVNGVEPGQRLEAGRKAKRVVGGELPETRSGRGSNPSYPAAAASISSR